MPTLNVATAGSLQSGVPSVTVGIKRRNPKMEHGMMEKKQHMMSAKAMTPMMSDKSHQLKKVMRQKRIEREMRERKMGGMY